MTAEEAAFGVLPKSKNYVLLMLALIGLHGIGIRCGMTMVILCLFVCVCVRARSCVRVDDSLQSWARVHVDDAGDCEGPRPKNVGFLLGDSDQRTENGRSS